MSFTLTDTISQKSLCFLRSGATREFFCGFLAFCACERVRRLVSSVNPELGLFGFG